MLLKVGELAKRTGLTVRSLHHYDDIGLLVPSERSQAGYRLYNSDDLARLHSIQALRHLGLSLDEITNTLADQGSDLKQVIERQMRLLEQEIDRAQVLHQRLHLLQLKMEEGTRPDMSDWLGALELMAAYSRYFDHEELKQILENKKRTASEWPALVADVKAAMKIGVPQDSPDLQGLAHRWINLSMRAMGNNFERMRRWKEMYQQELVVREEHGLDPVMLKYLGPAIRLRMDLFSMHFSPAELQSIQLSSEQQWQELRDAVRKLMAAGVAPESAEARALLASRDALMDQLANHDPLLKRKMHHAYSVEPLLRAGSMLGRSESEYMRLAALALTHGGKDKVKA